MSKKADDFAKDDIFSTTDSYLPFNLLKLISAVTYMPKKVKKVIEEKNGAMLTREKVEDLSKKVDDLQKKYPF